MGAGRFGRNHLRVLLKLEKQGLCKLAGVVVRTDKHRQELMRQYSIPIFNRLSTKLLQSVDGVDIATPTPTHFSLVKSILRHTNILVEKPLALNSRQVSIISKMARKYGKIVMVGHIYRFHPLIRKLHSIIQSMGDPYFISAKFLYPETKRIKWDILFELLHPFDIVEYLYNLVPQSGFRTHHNHWVSTSIFYPRKIKGLFDIGFHKSEKIRTLTFHFKNIAVHCDFEKNSIEIVGGKKTKTISCSSKPEPLQLELEMFLKVLRKEHYTYPDIALAQKIIAGIEKIKPQRVPRKPKIAIIGGGVFGATAAIELRKLGQVHLFERGADFMEGASYVNQYRHHMGYHYPRSKETVQESQEAKPAFEAVYGKAVVRHFPAFYCVSRLKSKISAENYLKFCRTNHLPFTRCYPSHDFLDRKKVSLCIKTGEPIYDYDQLKQNIKSHISHHGGISVHFGSCVYGGGLQKNGTKYLKVKQNRKKHKISFDFIVNATYARMNEFAHWFAFPIKPLRMDLVELVFLHLPILPIALTIMDGEFPTLVATGTPRIFTLGHVRESLSKSCVPPDGLVPQWQQPKSNWHQIVSECRKWFPILQFAEYIESRFVVRAVNAYREHDDARPSDIIKHGFGCWSLFGGKVITAVTTARSIAKELRKMIDSPAFPG